LKEKTREREPDANLDYTNVATKRKQQLTGRNLCRYVVNFRKGKIRFFFEVKKRFVIEIVYNEVGRWLLDGGVDRKYNEWPFSSFNLY